MYVSTNLTAILSEKHVQSIWLSLNEFDCIIQVITAVTSFYPAASNSSVEARQKHRTTLVVDNIVGYDMVESDNLMNKLDLYIPSYRRRIRGGRNRLFKQDKGQIWRRGTDPKSVIETRDSAFNRDIKILDPHPTCSTDAQETWAIMVSPLKSNENVKDWPSLFHFSCFLARKLSISEFNSTWEYKTS